jgi:hypothetical protein
MRSMISAMHAHAEPPTPMKWMGPRAKGTGRSIIPLA